MQGLCDIQGDLSTRTERLESHLYIFSGPKGYQVTILVLVLHSQRSVVPAWTTEANLLPYLIHELVEFRGSRDLYNENVVLKMDLDLHRRRVTVVQSHALEHLRP